MLVAPAARAASMSAPTVSIARIVASTALVSW
jgi:hypothetical protein